VGRAKKEERESYFAEDKRERAKTHPEYAAKPAAKDTSRPQGVPRIEKALKDSGV